MVTIDPLGITGTWSGILSSRISYLFDLKGPSVVIDTACSSGLVAVHQAVKAIREGECRQAIAGGVSGIQYLPIKGLHTALATYESSDGLVKTFDHRADGTVWSEGAGAVMLKSLKDALMDNDRIYAVIKGSAINNDGKSNGITAPNALAQEDMLINAWKDAGINPENISYIEAHGTGTALGDPIEIKALTNAFRRYTNKKQFCAIGSLKSNMGHLVGASGLAGLIKVILSLKNKQIPGTINFERPNEFINFTDSPLYIVAENLKWESGNKKRIAAINSFGFSGTNCHMVVEEPPTLPEQQQEDKSSTAAYAFVLSARNDTSFEQLITLTINTLHRGNAGIKDICYTAAIGRGHYEIRAAVIAYTREDLISKLVLLDKGGYKTHCDDWFFFGSHKIVPDDKRVKGQGEITEKEKKSLITDAVMCIQDLAKMPLFSIGKISVLCNYYIKGADIQWDTLYTGKTVELPPYPYKKEYHWPEPDMSDWGENLNRENTEIIHPLVEKLVIESIEQDIYSTRFFRDKHWQLSEHLVLGTNALPGTTFVEIIKIISQQYWGECPVEINNFVFYTPVAVDETNEGQEVQFIVKNNENHLDFLAISKTGSQWQRHAAGLISPMQETYSTHTLDLKKLISRCKPRENKDNTQNFTFGLRWRCVQDMYVGDNEFIHKITLRDEVNSDLEVYYLHPALLDQCVNCFSQDIYPGNMYLPYMYKKFKVYGPFPKTFYTHTLIKKSREETISFDFLVSDESGKVFLEINDYTIKKVHKKEFREKTGIGMKNNSFYKMNWNLLSRKPDSNSSGNCVALFHRETERSRAIKEALLNSGKEIIEVILSNTYKRLGEKKYTIDGSENSYHSLFKEIDQNSLTDIVHMFSEEEENVSIEDTLYSGIYSLFYMIKALAANKFNKKINLVVITNEANIVTGNEVSIK
ncbi:MAG: polyketide synthase dehydratase domain-containing protein, partial [Candidatus Pacearchaeota archaeon]|nr:polyketide synthase dehydratase domain-containing protein [Candidatus Pacearchaeota archaeon]